MTKPIAISILVAVTLATGCGDDAIEDMLDAGDVADARFDAPETTLPDASADSGAGAESRGVGESCPRGDECASTLFCLDESEWTLWPPSGYCTKPCTDDSQCGSGAFCAFSVQYNPLISGADRLCFRACLPDGTCELTGRVCSDVVHVQETTVLGRFACIAGTAGAYDGAPCATFEDCAAGAGCTAPNPFDAPGGYCATACEADDSVCSPPPGDTTVCDALTSRCIESCRRDTDCSRNAEGYGCVARAGRSVCAVTHAAPGSPCLASTECGPPVTPWQCLTGPSFPGGYCGAIGCDPARPASCPLGTFCFDPTLRAPLSGDELCAARCVEDSECRTVDGYRCLIVDPRDPLVRGCRLPP